jgi:hypothetical protein
MPNDGRPSMYPVSPRPTRLDVFLPQLPPSGRYGKFAWAVEGLLLLNSPNPRPVDLDGGEECWFRDRASWGLRFRVCGPFMSSANRIFVWPRSRS